MLEVHAGVVCGVERLMDLLFGDRFEVEDAG